MKKATSLTAASAVTALALAGALTAPAAQAVTTGGGGISLTTARTADSEAVELQRVRASVRSKGRVVKTSAPLLVTAEVPGEVTDVQSRTRLGLPTWRVVVEMESGYKVAAFVHRRTGVIIDWSVLKVPADVEYTPPVEEKPTPKPDPVKPKPAPVPAVVQDAIDAARGLSGPARAANSGAPSSTPAPAGAGPHGESEDDDHSGSDDERDSESAGDRNHESSGDSREDHQESRGDESSDDHRDDGGDRDRSDDRRDESRDRDDDPDDD